MKKRKITIALFFARPPQSGPLSYWEGWPKFLCRHPGLHCVPINVTPESTPRGFLSRFGFRPRKYDAIVFLHSVFSNNLLLDEGWMELLRSKREPKVYFIGNEYKLMSEKMSFSEIMNLSLLISQTDSPGVLRLYRERLGCEVVCIPSSGLDSEIYIPTTFRRDRPIDLGYRAYESPMYLGHIERRRIADYFLDRSAHYGLSADVSLNPSHRFGGVEWAAFLNRCKGQVGSEAGGDFFELTDSIRNRVISYLVQHSSAEFGEVYDQFFRNYPNPIPARMISGRHVEAAGTKTVQILFEGHYNGYLKPDEHYIPLKKDFSNVDESIAKFRDESYCDRVTQNAYDLVHQELTYQKLIDKFHEALRQVL